MAMLNYLSIARNVVSIVVVVFIQIDLLLPEVFGFIIMDMFSMSMSEVSTSTFFGSFLVLAITSGLLFNRIKVLCICTHVVRIIVLLYKVSLPVFRPECLRLCEDL